VGRVLDRVVLIDVLQDLGDLGLGIADPAKRDRDGLVDDLEHPAADQLLVLDQGDVGLDAGGIAVHHEADRPGGGDDGRL
jgi:hypothetical protein